MDTRRPTGPRSEVPRQAATLAVSVILTLAGMTHPAEATTHVGSARHLEGRWERIPAPPNLVGLAVTDAVALPDGDIVTLLAIRGETNSGTCVSVFEPRSETWTDQAISGDAVEDGRCFLADEQFVVAPDDRMYSTRIVVDPTREPWEVDPGRLGDLDSQTELPLAIAGDLIYVMDVSRSGGRAVTRLVEIDLAADTARATASLEQWNWWLVAGPADSIYAVSLSGAIARYDPANSAWYDEAPAPPADLDRASAAMGPDGRIYLLGDDVSPHPELWAWDPEVREWLTVAIPDGLSGEFWTPQFVAGKDGALYAMDIAQPYRFVPGEVAQPATPEAVPTGGYGGPTGPTPTSTSALAPNETSTPTTAATPTASPTSSESPATVSTNPTQSPTVDAEPASARTTDGGSVGLIVLLVVVGVALLGVVGVIGWRWWQDRRPRLDPPA